MARRGRRRRLAPGIFSDDGGIAAKVRVGSGASQRSREQRFPADTDLVTIEQWQLRTRAELLGDMPVRPLRDSLAAAVPRYLATLTGRRRDDDRALAQHWIDSPLGPQPRHAIRKAQILAQLAAWEDAGAAASSINHRLRVLRAIYRLLDAHDDDAYDPTAGIKKRREPEPEARGVHHDLIEAIIAHLAPWGRPEKDQRRAATVSKTRARARVMAWTGLPPAQVMKMHPGHFNAAAATLQVTPRRKGKGTKARTIPLLPQAVEALKYFFAVGAAGAFSTSGFYKLWIAAQRRLVRALEAVGRRTDPSFTIELRRIRPYDLRHSFGTAAVMKSRNLLGVKELMLQARIATTERYLLGAAAPSAQEVIESWRAESVPPSGAPHTDPHLADSGHKSSPVSSGRKPRAQANVR